METKISKLEEDKAGLEKEVSDLKRSCEMIEKRAAEQKVVIFKLVCKPTKMELALFCSSLPNLFRWQMKRIMQMRSTS